MATGLGGATGASAPCPVVEANRNGSGDVTILLRRTGGSSVLATARRPALAMSYHAPVRT